MEKRNYLSPSIVIKECFDILMTNSLGDPDGNGKSVSPWDDKYGGEFHSRKAFSFDDEDDEEY